MSAHMSQFAAALRVTVLPGLTSAGGVIGHLQIQNIVVPMAGHRAVRILDEDRRRPLDVTRAPASGQLPFELRSDIRCLR